MTSPERLKVVKLSEMAVATIEQEQPSYKSSRSYQNRPAWLEEQRPSSRIQYAQTLPAGAYFGLDALCVCEKLANRSARINTWSLVHF